MDGVEVAVQRAALSARQGFKAIKTKIGYASLEEDIAIVRAIREATGDELAIMVDYNQSLTVPEAIRRGRALQDLGVFWIEEPVAQADHAGHARIARELHVPLQLGENWSGPEDMFHACQESASDLAMLDVMKIGGVTGWMKAAALAEQFSMPLSSHIFQEISAHLLCGSPGADWLERMDIAGAVVESSIKLSDGFATPSSEPGTGITWKESAVEKYLV